MRIIAKTVSKAIKEKTGMDVSLINGGGYFYFISDDDVIGDILMSYGTSIYVYRLNDQSLERWVSEFETIWDVASKEAELNSSASPLTSVRLGGNY